MSEPTTVMEIIAVASGKGGTGKTLITSCLGYVLTRAGHRVLMIDGDLATDGLSLMLLGPKGMKHISDFKAPNTFKGTLQSFDQSKKTVEFRSFTIDRSGSGDHGVRYNALISGRDIYGDSTVSTNTIAGAELERDKFRLAVQTLFRRLQESGAYDYVLIDTRGGFGFESTDICALADSFILVTDPDYTSFYQDRNLVKRISATASELQTKSLLRAIIVNKATEGDERSFRVELEKEFPIKFDDTFPIPLDIEAIKAYKTQSLPYVVAPASQFSYATLTAFADILHVVTAQWSAERVAQWNVLVADVSKAIETRNEKIKEAEKKEAERAERDMKLGTENTYLRNQIEDLKKERERFETLLAHQQSPFQQAQGSEGIYKIPRQAKSSRGFAIGVLALLVLVGAGLVAGYFFFKRPTTDGLLEKVYQTELPPQLRMQYLRTLLSAGHRQFDSIKLAGYDLKGLDLQGTSFRGANLEGADLGRANLESADLNGANLSNANLQGANLSNANLQGANLKGVDLTNAIGLLPKQLLNAKVDDSTLILEIPPALLRASYDDKEITHELELVSEKVKLKRFSEAREIVVKLISHSRIQNRQEKADFVKALGELSDRLKEWERWEVEWRLRNAKQKAAE